MSAAKAYCPLIGPDVHSPEWYALRLFDPNRQRPVVFGASEAAGACNVSPYTTALQLYLEKRRELPDPELSEESQERVEIGLEMEPVILRLYRRRMKCDMREQLPMYLHPKHSFLGATPDAQASFDGGPEWTVDSKNSGWRMYDSKGESDHKYGEAGTDEVPLTNLYQAQQQMAVMGTERVDFPVVFDNTKLRIYSVPRNDDLIRTIIDAEKELAERIVNADPPEPNYEHTGTRRLLQEMFGLEVGRTITLDTTLLMDWLKREELSATKKSIEDELDEINNRLLHRAEAAQFLEFENSEIRVKRIIIADSFVTQEKVDQLQARVGDVDRRGHVRLQRVKSAKG